MKYQAIIFDWDGTLADSASRIVESMQCAAKDFDLPYRSEYDVKQIIGLGLPEAIVSLWPQLEADRTVVKGVAKQYGIHYHDEQRSDVVLFDYALELLVLIESLGLKVAVATGKSRTGLDRVLSQFDLAEHFDDTRCADETRSKPHPLMLHELSQSLNVDNEKMLMIGDTQFDLDMAHNAGMDSVAITHGAHSVEKLKLSSPMLMVDDLKQFAHWLSCQSELTV
ncbi:MAG: phosphoglycolate phosphatase [Oceanicoccus sp.]|jgi:phosphoglycolate phosphatase